MLRKRSRCIFHRTGGKRPDKLCKPPFPSPDAFATLHSSLQKRPKTPSEHQHNRTANSVAVVLHECCTTFAALLHRLCSSAAKAMQHCCKGCAVELQRLCRKRAEARQKTCRGEAGKQPRQGASGVGQSVPTGQGPGAPDGRKKSGCLRLGKCPKDRRMYALFTIRAACGKGSPSPHAALAVNAGPDALLSSQRVPPA